MSKKWKAKKNGLGRELLVTISESWVNKNVVFATKLNSKLLSKQMDTKNAFPSRKFQRDAEIPRVLKVRMVLQLIQKSCIGEPVTPRVLFTITKVKSKHNGVV